ncbi:Pex19-domain-containing protein [Periconia macrospinosa]|uniref:Pex19-domain-containing protein n=1 Tax=Periconia macrospinosa TaxID=97972 RepID=A0A2V1D5Q9_9PLEO|nr:Pex19-domain-containing protein [Periconia macrospinosa]
MADPEKKQAETPPKPAADVASDPEEDDLSDLDDVLDEFANTKLDSKPAPPAASAAKPPAPSSSGPGRPNPEELLVQDEDAFAKELQKEMEQLLGQGDFQKQFEDIMKEVGGIVGEGSPAGEGAASSSSAEKTGAPSQKTEQTFQESIRKTMERMQESGDAASAAAASSSQDDILAQMLKEMESGGFGGEGSDEDFSKILMGMMEQLTNKDILYEPMKELHEKFPKWMEDNKEKTDEKDYKRYEEQQQLVKEITERFDRPGYADDNAQDREYIVERMQKMQAAGSPPPDLVGDMNAAQEALQDIDQGCPTQ